jgi:hypothetical protein
MASGAIVPPKIATDSMKSPIGVKDSQHLTHCCRPQENSRGRSSREPDGNARGVSGAEARVEFVTESQ